MSKISINTTKYAFAVLMAFSLVLSAFPAKASTYTQPMYTDPESLVCGVVSSLGLGCVGRNTSSNLNSSSNQNSNSANTSGTNYSNQGDVTNNYYSNYLGANIGSSIYKGKVRNISGNDISLVNVQGMSEIYAIEQGQKHLIPTAEIFYDYGFKPEMVQNISQYQLDKYPRADIIKVKGDKNLYFFTEGGMLRKIVDKKILAIYGDRESDAIEISKKEFNYYPQNQYVFVINPLNRDVFLIDGLTKRYVTPMAEMRMGIRQDQVAPILQEELDFYKTGRPIVY